MVWVRGRLQGAEGGGGDVCVHARVYVCVCV